MRSWGAVLILFGCPIVVSCTGDETGAVPESEASLTDLNVATILVDRWSAAWSAHDPVAIASAFTANATYQDIDEIWSGRESILDHAHRFNDIILKVRRVGEGWATDDGSFVVHIDFDFDFGSGPGTDVGEIEVAITNRLIYRVEWLNRERRD